MFSPPHIVFACGGSLGHVYPGLSIARSLIDLFPGARATFVGDGRAAERQTVRGAGYDYRPVPCKPRPTGALGALRFVTDNTLGLVASQWLLRETRASLVVGLGGHATAPLLRAALSLRLPAVLLEQNAMPSQTSRWLASRVHTVCLGFEEARARLPIGARTRVTGTPARPAFASLGTPRKTGPRLVDPPRRLVVIGGVGGAQSLNHSTPNALARLGGAMSGWTVVHQAGEGQLIDTERRYRAAGVNAVVVAFIDEMADLLRETDLVVSRSGGCTLAELALAGVPAVVAPDSRTGHIQQSENARILQQLGGCDVIDERRGDLTDRLAESIRALVADDSARRRFGDAIAATARPRAAEEIAEACRLALGSPSPVTPPIPAAA